MPSGDEDGWKEWRNHILAELTRLADEQSSMSSCLIEMKQDISALKVKSGIWGLLGGGIATIITIVVAWLGGIFKER